MDNRINEIIAALASTDGLFEDAHRGATSKRALYFAVGHGDQVMPLMDNYPYHSMNPIMLIAGKPVLSQWACGGLMRYESSIGVETERLIHDCAAYNKTLTLSCGIDYIVDLEGNVYGEEELKNTVNC